VEMSGGYMHLSESYNDPSVAQVADQYQQQIYGRTLFNNGSLIPLSISFVQETTVFREFGPLAGNTLRASYEYAPKVGNSLERRTLDADLRYYKRLAGTGLLAMRFRGFRSEGAYPNYMYFGGNSEMRGYDYLEFIGQKDVFVNAELRFPLIEAMLTPIGVMGGVRGVFYFNMGGGWFDNSGYVFWTNNTEQYKPFIGVATDPAGNPILDDNGNPIPLYGAPRTISGFRLRDARASYGLGLETFALGFPIHFDWSWRTLFNRGWEDTLFATNTDLETGTNIGGQAWRKSRFAVWIGYDF
jgi:outer membrane protein assembly factor BamA